MWKQCWAHEQLSTRASITKLMLETSSDAARAAEQVARSAERMLSSSGTESLVCRFQWEWLHEDRTRLGPLRFQRRQRLRRHSPRSLPKHSSNCLSHVLLDLSHFSFIVDIMGLSSWSIWLTEWLKLVGRDRAAQVLADGKRHEASVRSGLAEVYGYLTTAESLHGIRGCRALDVRFGN